MAWTPDDLTALDAAIATGALRVGYADGKSVTYRSLDEMIALRGLIRRELGLERAPIRKVYAPNKGIRAGGLNRDEWGRSSC